MSIFSTIVSKIFPSTHPAVVNSANATEAAPSAPSAPAAPAVDVNAVLSQMAKDQPQQLNWQTSIVDLMKLLGLDSSLTARKELAKELKFDGDMNDSAAMNLWLSKQVMTKLSQNGGKVPADLLH